MQYQINNTLAIPQKLTTDSTYSPQYKLHVLLKGFQKDVTVRGLCQLEGLPPSLYYKWRKQFMQGVENRFVCSKSRKISTKQLAKLKIANQLLQGTLNILKDCSVERNNQSQSITKIGHTLWMLEVLQNAYSFSDIKGELGYISHLETLLQYAIHGTPRERMRAISILAHYRGISSYAVAKFLNISKSSVCRYWERHNLLGDKELISRKSHKKLKSNDEANINAVFSLLHSPPSEFGINRTSWIMKDLKTCLAKRGVLISQSVIRKIIKNAGYTWRKAKVVLTSNDPKYRRKLNRIKRILSSLDEKERFFSIDEFGPFAVKMKSGRRLVAPDEYPSVPQFQKSKGYLIIIAALELSTNQITHFYSKEKNTSEVIRLLDLLLNQNKEYKRIYLSWDAASWHMSKKLNIRVQEVNKYPYRRKHGTPKVVFVPLPASAQFLNVVESVFSRMARAIIHNSNYGSVDEAKAAIDRYFCERNEHFRNFPSVAGKKIWGRELVPSQFNEAQNCKSAKFR